MGEGAGEIVGDGQHLTRKAGHGIGAGVGPVAFRTTARIFRLGQRAQELVLKLDIFGVQCRDHIGRMPFAGLDGLEFVFVAHHVSLTHQPSNRPTTFAVWSTIGMIRP
jgi:hypothetical protein